MIDSAIKFRSIDLNEPFSIPQKVDLTICLEVAEHLEPRISPQFTQCLTETSDVVLFSAAFLNEGGANHINEQQHSYWAKLFAGRDYYPFDFFRPVFWGNKGCRLLVSTECIPIHQERECRMASDGEPRTP